MIHAALLVLLALDAVAAAPFWLYVLVSGTTGVPGRGPSVTTRFVCQILPVALCAALLLTGCQNSNQQGWN